MAHLTIHNLGRKDYAEIWKLQHQLVEERIQGGPDVLLLVEHPHVLTRGSQCKGKTMGPQTEADIPIHDVERGGDATYHGPGQMVGYPILHLKERRLSLSQYIRGLEDVLIETVSPWVKAERLPGFTGIWARGKKLASIGVAVRRWVTYHGLALNVNTDLSYFNLIYPCRLEPSQMTSLKQLCGQPIPSQKVSHHFTQCFQTCFGFVKLG